MITTSTMITLPVPLYLYSLATLHLILHLMTGKKTRFIGTHHSIESKEVILKSKEVILKLKM